MTIRPLCYFLIPKLSGEEMKRPGGALDLVTWDDGDPVITEGFSIVPVHRFLKKPENAAKFARGVYRLQVYNRLSGVLLQYSYQAGDITPEGVLGTPLYAKDRRYFLFSGHTPYSFGGGADLYQGYDRWEEVRQVVRRGSFCWWNVFDWSTHKVITGLDPVLLQPSVFSSPSDRVITLE